MAEGARRTAGAGAGASARDAMREEVLAALAERPRRIPSKYHYDARGSRLFERITRTDEYYLTRAERALLERCVPAWTAELDPAALVELGPGSAEKSRTLLDAITARRPDALYVPVDVSGAYLAEVSDALRREYARLRVAPQVADITQDLGIDCPLPEPTWVAFLGSTLGNFEDEGAVRLLRRVRALLGREGRLLLGVDLKPGPRKPRARVELAYNDRAGLTEAFSRNLLSVLNREVGSDFDPEAFAYHASYVPERGRIETYLESLRAQTVRFPGAAPLRLAAGERILTEISAKYDRPSVEALFEAAGLGIERWVEDADGYYALVLGEVVPSLSR